MEVSLSFSQLEISIASILLAIAQESALFVSKQTAFLTFLQKHLKEDRGVQLHRYLQDPTFFSLRVVVVAIVIIASKLIEIKHLKIVRIRRPIRLL